jgi:dihydrofolate reductase
VGKIIVSTYMTLDGVIQPLDWFAPPPDKAAAEERGKYAADLLFEADALLLGRETYQVFAEVWPTRTAADDDPGGAGVTDRINSMPKYVVSSTLTEPLAWNATLINGDVPSEIAKLKARSGHSLVVYGCGRLAKTLLDHNLVDEFRFWVYPSVRGNGTRLFNDGVSADLELVDAKTFRNGFVVLTCRPKSAV